MRTHLHFMDRLPAVHYKQNSLSRCCTVHILQPFNFVMGPGYFAEAKPRLRL